ncbi:hypothetical protein EJB05_33885, partial [Eragrostis curvula]
LAVAAVAVLAVAAFSGLPPVAEASIQSTCQAAAHDKRVDVPFCVSQFTAYHGAAEADAWGLAKTAALVGVNLSDDATFDLANGKVTPPPAKAAAAACTAAYDAVGLAFAEAADELGARRYAAASGKMAGVAAIARRCDVPALAKYSADCEKMAVIGIAITSLIK